MTTSQNPSSRSIMELGLHLLCYSNHPCICTYASHGSASDWAGQKCWAELFLRDTGHHSSLAEVSADYRHSKMRFHNLFLFYILMLSYCLLSLSAFTLTLLLGESYFHKIKGRKTLSRSWNDLNTTGCDTRLTELWNACVGIFVLTVLGQNHMQQIWE
jgi:hypothetical protein